MVNFAIRHDKKSKLRFAPLQSEAAQDLLKQYNVSPSADTVVLIHNGKAYTYASASARLCQYLDWPAKALYAFVLIPPFISQPVYKWFAKRRYKWFGKKEACMVPSPEIKKRFLS